MSKVPNSHAIDSEWHRRNDRMGGVDFRQLYRRRASFWFCDTYIPTTDEFLRSFRVLDGHMPTTGFAAILDVLDFNPKSVFLTGFDFFTSGLHNVNEPWREKKENLTDPIRHMPELERAWLIANMDKHPITVDRAMSALIPNARRAA